MILLLIYKSGRHQAVPKDDQASVRPYSRVLEKDT